MGKKKGKSIGKAIASIAVGLITGTLSTFGASIGYFSNFAIGASLMSTLWTTISGTGVDTDSSTSADVTRFDKSQETMSSSGRLPLIYGCRKVCGNQTYHEVNADQNTLHKHIVLCEGGIQGIESVCANDLLIPTGSQTNGVVLTITNVKYSDAYVAKSGKNLTLSANGQSKTIYLCNKDDAEKADTYYEWQLSISSLISYINRLNEGWQAFPTATTSKYPGDLYDSAGSCYNNPISYCAATVTGGTTYSFYDCQPPSNYETVGGYPNMAWLDMTFSVSSELNGNPSVSCVVKGKKVYDSRTGVTAYSTNPAMCLRDFILSKRYGLGKWFDATDIDTDSWNEAADYCDEVITFRDGSGANVSAKRYELNMVIDEKRSALEWIQNILANFCGFIVFSDGKLKLRIEKQTPISYRFNDGSCKDLKIEPLALSETPNCYEVSIVDPLNNWSSVKCLCDDYADQKMRQKIVTKAVSLEGVTSQNQALRLARFYRDYNLVCPLQINFTTGMQAMHLEPGDVVTVSFHNIFTNLPIRISEIKETEKGTFEISGRQYNDTIYGDVLGGGIHWYNYTVAEGVGNEDEADDPTPNKPTNLSASSAFREYADGSTGYDITVQFSIPTYAEAVVVYYKTDAVIAEQTTVFAEGVAADELGYQEEWKCAGEGVRNVIISGANVGDTYMIRAVARSGSGKLSDYTNAIYCKVTPKATVPAQPYNLRTNFVNSFLFEWNDIDDTDAIYYELRTNTNVGATAGLLGRTNSTSLEVGLTSRTGTAYLYAINSQKNASYPAIVDWNKPYPAAPTVTSQSTLTGALLSVGAFPADIKKVCYYIEGDNYSDAVTQATPSYLLEAEADIYSVRASLWDIFGEGIRSDAVSVTITPTFSGEYIEDGTIAMDKVNAAVAQALADGTSANNQIVQLVKSASDQSEAEGYSAITQLSDAINFRVSKAEMDGEDIIAQINLTAKGTTISGDYLHVSGETKFDDNVITEGMLSANAVTAEKIASKSVSADKMDIQSLSAISATIGTLRTKTSGARVEISDNLICVYDYNNVCRVKIGVF